MPSLLCAIVVCIMMYKVKQVRNKPPKGPIIYVNKLNTLPRPVHKFNLYVLRSASLSF